METYNGQVRTPTDAIILFEACRMGILPRVQRRLSEKERQSIRSGSVFVWDEREAGMRRWTDGKSWSASRVSGSFLTYREMEGKRGGSSFVTPAAGRGAKTPDSARNSAEDANGADGEEGPDGYRYKPDGLMKQSFSITTSQGQHLHLISYYSRSHPTAQSVRQPSTDPNLSSIQIPKGMYPESTVNDQSNTPAVTRSPMPGAPNYVMAPSPTYGKPPPPHPYYPGFIHHPAGYVYPISPMHTPPGAYAIYPHAHPAGLPPLGYPAGPYAHPQVHMSAGPGMGYDQRPLRNSLPHVSGQHTQVTQGPPALHQSLSAPSIHSLPPPNMTPQPHDAQSPTSSGPNASTPNVNIPQIDPRLTESTAAPISEPYSSQMSGSNDYKFDTQPLTTIATTASQAPTIGALVNGSPVSPKTPLPNAEHTKAGKESEGQGSTSPGGTNSSVPPQDIPSEKLGFREDMRALSKLDRVFARV